MNRNLLLILAAFVLIAGAALGGQSAPAFGPNRERFEEEQARAAARQRLVDLTRSHTMALNQLNHSLVELDERINQLESGSQHGR